MKLNYKNQLTITILIGFVFSGLNMLLHHWIFTSIGRILAGLLWVVHPVMFGTVPPTRKQKWIIRGAGIFLILYGVFGRLYLY